MACGCAGSTPPAGATRVNVRQVENANAPVGGPGEPSYYWNGPQSVDAQPAAQPPQPTKPAA